MDLRHHPNRCYRLLEVNVEPTSNDLEKDEKLVKLVKASPKIEVEERAGIMAAKVKEKVFKVDAPV